MFTKYFQTKDMTVKNIWEAIFTGEFQSIWRMFLSWIKDGTIGEVIKNKELLEIFLLFGITSVIIKYISVLFSNSQTVEMAKQIMNLSFLVFTIYACVRGIQIAKGCLEAMYVISKVALPVYLISMSLANSITMASAFSGIFALIMFMVEKVVKAWLFPFLGSIEILHMVDHAILENRMHTGISYCEKGVMMLMRGLVCGISAVGYVQSNVLSASADVKKTTIGSLSSLLPGVGKLAEESMDIFLGSTALIYRCMGSLMGVLFSLICMIPFVKLLFLLFTVRFAESIMGMLGEEGLQKGIHISGEAIKTIMHLLFGVLSLFLLTIVVAMLGAK